MLGRGGRLSAADGKLAARRLAGGAGSSGGLNVALTCRMRADGAQSQERK